MDGKAKDVAINSRETVEFVILTMRPKGFIHFNHMVEDTPYQSFAKSAGSRTESAKCVEIFKIGNSSTSPEIALVEELNGSLTAFASDTHGNQFLVRLRAARSVSMAALAPSVPRLNSLPRQRSRACSSL